MTTTIVFVFLFGAIVGYGVGHFRNPRCWYEAIRSSIRTGARVEGHSYVARECLNHCEVTTLQCEWCEGWTVLWSRTAASSDVSDKGAAAVVPS